MKAFGKMPAMIANREADSRPPVDGLLFAVGGSLLLWVGLILLIF